MLRIEEQGTRPADTVIRLLEATRLIGTAAERQVKCVPSAGENDPLQAQY